jgi:hypothetical protein
MREPPPTHGRDRSITRHRALTAAVACAAALTGCGSGSAGGGTTGPAPRPGAPIVTLELVGSTREEQLLGCSSVHHYAIFNGGRIALKGTVHPVPEQHRWKIKVKIKRCVDGRFQDSGSDRIVGLSSGKYTGSLQPPGKGVFFARAGYRSAGGDVLSDKVFFEVR